jgi:hypothetical protein
VKKTLATLALVASLEVTGAYEHFVLMPGEYWINMLTEYAAARGCQATAVVAIPRPEDNAVRYVVQCGEGA